jgi:hypothetical protein
MNPQYLESAAILCSGLFAGAALYVSLVQHPGWMECGTELAVKEFNASYRRAAAMQASLAFLSFLFSGWAWYLSRDATILLAGVIVFLAIPYTLLVILPTNKRLADPTLDKSSNEAQALLVKWGHLHQVRMLMGLVGFVLMVMSR